MKQHYIFWFVILVCFVSVVGGIFWWNYSFDREQKNIFTNITPNVTRPEWLRVDTSSWKLYENKKFGFSFKYPPEFQAFPCYGQMLFCLNVGEKNTAFQDNGFGIRIYDRTKLNSLDETGFIERQMSGLVWRVKQDSVRAFRMDFGSNLQMRAFATSSYSMLDSIVSTFQFVK